MLEEINQLLETADMGEADIESGNLNSENIETLVDDYCTRNNITNEEKANLSDKLRIQYAEEEVEFKRQRAADLSEKHDELGKEINVLEEIDADFVKAVEDIENSNMDDEQKAEAISKQAEELDNSVRKKLIESYNENQPEKKAVTDTLENQDHQSQENDLLTSLDSDGFNMGI